MDLVQIIQTIKASDPMTAVVVAGIFIFYAATRLQKWRDTLATKKDLADRQKALEMDLINHKKSIYESNLVLEGSVSGTLEKIAQKINDREIKDNQRINDHEDKDDRRFETLDKSTSEGLRNMDKKVNKANLALVRIQTVLKIEVPEEDL